MNYGIRNLFKSSSSESSQTIQSRIGLFYKSEGEVFLTFHHPMELQFQSWGAECNSQPSQTIQSKIGLFYKYELEVFLTFHHHGGAISTMGCNSLYS